MIDQLKQRYWRFIEGWRKFKRQQLTPWPRMLRVCSPPSDGARAASDRSRKEFLLLSWNFPPLVNGGVYRPTALCQGAIRAGWHVSVLAGEMPSPVTPAGMYLLDRVPHSVRILRPLTHDPKAGPMLLPRIDGGLLNALEGFDVITNEFRRAPPPIIVATGPPFQSFVAGVWLANYFGSSLVLDYRDEWTEGPHDHIQRDQANCRWEHRCLRRADRVVFTTQSQLRHQLRVFPGLDETKCVVIPNGWDPEDFTPDEQVKKMRPASKGAAARIMFLGNLGTWWNLSDFLQPLAQAFTIDPTLRDKVEIHFVGGQAPAALKALNAFPFRDRVVITEHVPKATACALMRGADVLLLLNPPTLNRYIPGKTFEYVAAGAPILVYGEGGEMQDIVTKLGVGLVIRAGDATTLAKGIHQLLDNPRPTNSATTNWLASHTREKTGEQFIAVLEELLHPASGA